MEQWIQYIGGVAFMGLCFKLLISRLDRNEKALDKLSDKVEVGLQKVSELFVTKERCKELRDVKKCKGDD